MFFSKWRSFSFLFQHNFFIYIFLKQNNWSPFWKKTWTRILFALNDSIFSCILKGFPSKKHVSEKLQEKNSQDSAGDRVPDKTKKWPTKKEKNNK